MLRGLLKYIHDINTLDNNLQNAAHICAKHGELECLRLLAANGIDLRHKDSVGMEPSHVAAYYNQAHVIEFLFEMGVPIDEYCSGGKTPLHYACQNGSLDAVRTINAYSIDISIPELHEGNTGAHLAAKHDKLDCLKLLASLGLPLTLVTNQLGRNLAHVCCLYGSVRCLHWLLDNHDFDLFCVDSKTFFIFNLRLISFWNFVCLLFTFRNGKYVSAFVLSGRPSRVSQLLHSTRHTTRECESFRRDTARSCTQIGQVDSYSQCTYEKI